MKLAKYRNTLLSNPNKTNYADNNRNRNDGVFLESSSPSSSEAVQAGRLLHEEPQDALDVSLRRPGYGPVQLKESWAVPLQVSQPRLVRAHNPRPSHVEQEVIQQVDAEKAQYTRCYGHSREQISERLHLELPLGDTDY